MSNIREVAKRAGVSTATVSRGLSRPDVVSPEYPRARTQGGRASRLRAQLGGEEPAHAQSRKLLEDGSRISILLSLILQGIEDAAQKNGYAVVSSATRSTTRCGKSATRRC